ncbi:MAG: lipoyl protein ligase domain-containing protein, partial [Chloroflexota bacterium]
MKQPLRLLRLGGVTPLRSQTIYHALGRGVSRGAANTLAIVHSTAPYVCVGYHRDAAAEVDLEYCRQRGLPVYRRQVG